jgi:hypothetical protein
VALKFRLRGLAETFVDEIHCPCCGSAGKDDDAFSTEFTRVTLDGICVVTQCKRCAEIFVPKNQRVGIVSFSDLEKAIQDDHRETGEPIYGSFKDVVLSTEKLNALRKGEFH